MGTDENLKLDETLVLSPETESTLIDNSYNGANCIHAEGPWEHLIYSVYLEFVLVIVILTATFGYFFISHLGNVKSDLHETNTTLFEV